MSQSQPPTPNDFSNHLSLSKPSRFMANRRQQTEADFRPPPLQQNNSTASSLRLHGFNRQATQTSSRPNPDRFNSTPGRMRRTGTSRTNQTNTTGSLIDAGERAEREPKQTVEVDNEYSALNPWYNQQKAKPVFGLASPLPRTVRKGMWWGRGDLKKSLYKVDEGQDNEGQKHNDGIDRTDALDFHKDVDDFGNDSEETQIDVDQGIPANGPKDPDYFSTTIEGRKVNMRRVPTSEANNLKSHHQTESSGPDRAPVNEHGLSYNNQGDESGGTQRHQFGLADGLPPLQELESHETTQSESEKQEIQHREHEAQQDYYNQYRNPIARLRAQYPQAPAEFLATFVYLFLGICVNLSVATSQEKTGSFETQAWGWGFAVMIGIYLAGGVSGAHLSPTISISLTIYRGFPWRMALIYICVQMLAGLAAGALAFGLYRDAILQVDPNLTLDITGKALFPKGPSFSIAGGFFNDFVYMAIWVCTAFALGDDQNSPPGQGMTALIFGFNGFLTMIALGYNTGLGISPARDLGPRLVGLWAGYDEAFDNGYWAYGPWGASISGALFGGLMYDLFIFVGGESPVNYRWPQPGDIKWRAKKVKSDVKDKIQDIA
ncbi:aquaporin-like protein [Phaeosphaeria sp. MPI-PUGE-AT-0046c]|nr:aquaporin-like protein [Phaeosphaeria sp. MPI-PUGE-AT-0046c]